VEYRRHAVNRGHIDTYNEGLLEWAAGDYVLLLSADDLLAPGALGRAARVLDEHPEVGLIHGRQAYFATDPVPEPDPEGEDVPCEILSGPDFVARCCARAHNPVSTPTAVVRTAVQHAVGGYRKALPHTADMELWLRCAARGAVAYLETLQALNRVHDNNMQHQYLATALRDVQERHDAFEAFFREDGRRIPGHERLSALVRRYLGGEAFWAASEAFDAGDEEACDRFLDYALKLNPGLRSQRIWSRLRWKRRLGCRLWGLVRPLMQRLRRRKAPAANPRA
jgi:hypothetical protein